MLAARRVAEVDVLRLVRLLEALARQREQDALDADGKARGRAGAAEVGQQVVVAAAAGEREAEARRVRLEDHARVVAEVADDAEVEAHVLLDAVRLEQAVDLREVVERAAALLIERERVALLEHLRAAIEHGQVAERLLGLLGQVERSDRAVEGDEVVLLERRLQGLLRLICKLVLVHDARDELDLAEADREVREAGAQQALDGQRDDLGIGKGRR